MNSAAEERLAEVLQEEIDLYEEILEIKAREKEALFAFSTTELEATASAQESLAARGGILEMRRIELVRELIPREASTKPDLHLTDVLEHVSGEHRARLERLGFELVKTCAEVARAQNENAEIIGSSAGYLRDLFERLIDKSRPRAVAYDSAGVKRHGKETPPSLWDLRL
jgi:flagellar biosynthesis/type III secretory pathway chaperone